MVTYGLNTKEITMALTAELVNPSYGYINDGAVSYNVTLELKNDGVMVATKGISTITNLLKDGSDRGTTWVQDVQAAVKAQAEAYINQYKLLMQIINAYFPTATLPQDAVDTLTSSIVLEV